MRQSGALGGHSLAVTLEIADYPRRSLRDAKPETPAMSGDRRAPRGDDLPDPRRARVEGDERDADRAAQQVKEIMERVAGFRVPLAVDVTIGRHWGEI